MYGQGLMQDKLDIKILILFILRRLPERVAEDVLTELAISESGVGYFDYAEALAELVDTDHVTHEKSGYKITEKGIRNGTVIESSIPYSVRNKAERLLAPIAMNMRRDAMIKTSHELTDVGCMVELSMADNKGDIISMKLVTSSEDQAQIMENNFRKNAEEIYNKIAEMMLKD